MSSLTRVLSRRQLVVSGFTPLFTTVLVLLAMSAALMVVGAEVLPQPPSVPTSLASRTTPGRSPGTTFEESLTELWESYDEEDAATGSSSFASSSPPTHTTHTPHTTHTSDAANTSNHTQTPTTLSTIAHRLASYLFSLVLRVWRFLSEVIVNTLQWVWHLLQKVAPWVTAYKSQLSGIHTDDQDTLHTRQTAFTQLATQAYIYYCQRSHSDGPPSLSTDTYCHLQQWYNGFNQEMLDGVMNKDDHSHINGAHMDMDMGEDMDIDVDDAPSSASTPSVKSPPLPPQFAFYDQIYSHLMFITKFYAPGGNGTDSDTGGTILNLGRTTFVFLAIHTQLALRGLTVVAAICASHGTFFIAVTTTLDCFFRIIRGTSLYHVFARAGASLVVVHHTHLINFVHYTNVDRLALLIQLATHVGIVLYSQLLALFRYPLIFIMHFCAENCRRKEAAMSLLNSTSVLKDIEDAIEAEPAAVATAPTHGRILPQTAQPSPHTPQCADFAFLKLQSLSQTSSSPSIGPHGLVCGFIIDAPDDAPRAPYTFVKVLFQRESLARIAYNLSNPPTTPQQLHEQQNQFDPMSVACVVYARHIDVHDIYVYQQIPISVTSDPDNYGNRILRWWIANSRDTNAAKFHQAYGHMLKFDSPSGYHNTDASAAIGGLPRLQTQVMEDGKQLFPPLSLHDPPDMRVYKSRYHTPVLDIYGRLHPSLGSYLCAQYHMEYATFAPRASSKLASSSSELTNLTLDAINPQMHLAEQAQAQAQPQTQTQVLICDADQQCRLQSQDNLLCDGRADHDTHQSQVQINTNHFKDAVIAGVAYCAPSLDEDGRPQNIMFGKAIPTSSSDISATEIDDILAQLTPESSGTFRVAKSMLKAIGAVAAYVPSFFKRSSVFEGVLNLNDFTTNTDIQFGAPVTYSQFLKQAKPGDMIAVHGFAALSNVICTIQSKLRGGSKFLSHVGILVDTTIIRSPGMVDGEMYLLESSAGGGVIGDLHDSVPNIFGLAKSGVQIRSMRLLLTQAVRQKCIYIHCPLKAEYRSLLDMNAGIHRTLEHRTCGFSDAIPRYINRPYTLTAANFLLGVESACADFYGPSSSSSPSAAALTTAPICHRDATNHVPRLRGLLSAYGKTQSTPFGSEFFCSELVAALYVELGILQMHGDSDIDDIWGVSMDEEFAGDLAKTRAGASTCTASPRIASPRHIYPIDFFSQSSRIYMPYLFDKLHVIHPVE